LESSVLSHKKMKKGLFVSIVFWLGILFLYLPMFFVVLYSFNSFQYPLWKSFSLGWYKALLHNDPLINSLWVSLKVASLSGCCAVVIGTTCALALTRSEGLLRSRAPKRPFLTILSRLPLVVPETIMGLSLLLFLIGLSRWIGLPTQGGVGTMTIAHTILGYSYVLSIVQSRLMAVEEQLEEAAQDLGAHPIKGFFLITLPLIWPSLAAGWLLTFVLSLDDVVLASFTTGPGADTLSLMIFSSLKLGLTPQINALATVLLVTVGLLVITAGYIVKKWVYVSHDKEGEAIR
jgi:putrescine transport system permease protein